MTGFIGHLQHRISYEGGSSQQQQKWWLRTKHRKKLSFGNDLKLKDTNKEKKSFRKLDFFFFNTVLFLENEVRLVT